jgi:hypothetical protein
MKEASVFTKISAYNLSTESNLFLKIGYGGRVIFFWMAAVFRCYYGNF